MPFVKRENGNIVSLYANPAVGEPKEFLPDDDPEVVAFNTPRAPRVKPALVDATAADNSIAALRIKINELTKIMRDAGLAQ